MRSAMRPASCWTVVVIVVILVIWFSPSSTRADAQTAGNNAVYNSSGNCSPSSPCAGSSAFIDAFVLAGANDICATIHNILQPATYSVAVIDARGISGSALTCASSPWGSGTGYLNKPSTILLPAGTIVISSTWNLPMNTHLVGVGDNVSSGTIIQACGRSRGQTEHSPVFVWLASRD